MTKAEFLDKLCQGLRLCPSSDEAVRTVNFYSEAIDDRMEDGMTEEEAVAAMGNIDDIVRELASSWQPSDGADAPGDRVRPGEVRRVFSPAAVTRIEVFDTSGEIDILPSRDGDIHIEYDATESWRYDISGESVITVRRAANAVQDKQARVGIFGKNFSLLGCSGASADELHLNLFLPASGAPSVSVNASSCDVEARNVSPAELFVKLGSGDVTLRDLVSAGKVSAVTVSGDAEARGLTASEIAVSTVSGDIDLDVLKTPALNLRTVSGDMEATDLAVSERLDAGSVSGDITLALSVPCRRAGIDSVSGDVELDLAGDGSLYTVTVKTVSGAVNKPAGARTGPREVRVKTMSGDIDIAAAG